MADAALNPGAVDAALADVAKPADVVPVPAAELLRLRQVDQQFADLNRDTAASFISRDLASALADAGNLVPGSSQQLIELWSRDFEAKRIDGQFQVVAKAGGTVAEVVRARLASPAYAHFVRATGRGGARSDATTTTPSGNLGGDNLTPVGRIAANMAAQRSAHGARGIGIPTR